MIEYYTLRLLPPARDQLGDAIFNQWNLNFYGSNKRSRIIQRNPP